MTFDSLSESSLLRLEQYLNSNPYREYSMNKPYLPKTSQTTIHTNRLISQPQPPPPPPILAFHELMENQKGSLTLDRLAYKLRMKSDLNIDTLRETHIRRRRHQYNHPQQNHINSNVSDTSSSILPLASTKTFGRQPTAITLSTNTMKTLVNEDLNGIEGSAVRVGTLDDLIKQFRRAEFRLVRRPADYLDSASTYLSSDVSTNDRTIITKPHQHQQHQERSIKQPQALTEYRFNAPTFPSTSSRTCRDPPIHQGLIYQYRTRERLQHTDLPLLEHRSFITCDQTRQRLNSLIIQERQPTAMSSHDKRVHELREKSLMRTEKQLCICNILNIADPFNSNSEQFESSLPHLQQSQPSANYIFPPVRPFGYFTKKTTTDDTRQELWSPPPPLPRHSKKKRGTKKNQQKISENSVDSLDTIGLAETNDEDDNSQLFNDTIKSMVSLTDLDDDIDNTTNTIINVDLNNTRAFTQNTVEQDEP